MDFLVVKYGRLADTLLDTPFLPVEFLQNTTISFPPASTTDRHKMWLVSLSNIPLSLPTNTRVTIKSKYRLLSENDHCLIEI